MKTMDLLRQLLSLAWAKGCAVRDAMYVTVDALRGCYDR
jgi:hypothetical protein